MKIGLIDVDGHHYKVCCGSLTCGNETLWWGDKGTAIRVWNTRAPIMSSEEMEILNAKD